MTSANPRQSRGLTSFRTGISLTEVLIAMGILTVGLLGVASIFPVASFYMQQGDIADRGSQIAQSAFNNAITSGQLDPANWWTMAPSNAEPAAANMTIDGAGLYQNNVRPVLTAIEECKARWPASGFCARMGGVFLIDPIGVAALSVYDPSAPVSQVASREFPVNARMIDLTKTFTEVHWRPWFADPNLPAVWPVRRVTFRQPRSNNLNSTNYFVKTQPLDRTTAERTFSSSDDLAIEVPTQANRPSNQQLAKFNIGGNMVPLARQSKGDYSWLITAVPSNPLNLLGATCEVSVVVFYKRPLGGTVTDNDTMATASQEERMTKAKIISTGLSGGEVLLEGIDENNDGVTDDGISESPFVNLKKGRWIMLSGPAPNSTADRPQFVARWYQVMSIDDSTDVVANPAMQRLVSLRGPQWPWQPATSGGGALDLDVNHLSNNLSAAIIPGAVAVHSKTIRLEGKSAWSTQ